MRNIKNAVKIFLIPVLALSLASCADIEVPTPGYILKRPIGTSSVKIGMSKDKVRELWGDPDQVNYVTDKKKWGGEREEWVYSGRYASIPVDAGYLSKTKRLYFDGDSLTNITESE